VCGWLISTQSNASWRLIPLFGAFIFPDAWQDPSAFRALLGAFGERGVDAVMTESVDYDAGAIEAVHEAGLRFYAGVACFSDHASNFQVLHERPELWPILETGERRPQNEWYIGLTPTDERRQREVLAAISAIASNYEIDGLFLDFVRWPLHWEIELRPGLPRALDSSFDPISIAAFEKVKGSLPPDLTDVASRAAWIRGRRLSDWVDFKCGVITDFVGRARDALKAVRASAELGIYVVPNVKDLTEPLTGQRIAELAPLVDWLCPMLYHNILLQPPNWVGAKIAEVGSIAGRKTLPVLQADSNRDPDLAADWGPPMSDADWRAALSNVHNSEISGLIVFPGLSLASDNRGEALQELIGRWR
jgi:hypothetical protein